MEFETAPGDVFAPVAVVVAYAPCTFRIPFRGIQWFRPVTSSPRYSSPLKEPGSPPKTIEFASCLSTSVNTLTFLTD